MQGSWCHGKQVAVYILCFHGGSGGIFCNEPYSWCPKWVSQSQTETSVYVMESGKTKKRQTRFIYTEIVFSFSHFSYFVM